MGTKEKFNPDYDPDNPYAIGRREFDNQYGRLAKNVAAWRRIAFVMLVLLIISTAVVLFMAQTVKVVPFVVQVDEHGYAIAVQAADRQGDITLAVNDRIIMSRLSDFITNMRSIRRDHDVQLEMLNRTYDTVAAGSMAQSKLNSYFSENNPLEKQNFTVEVIINSILRSAPDSRTSWQADWSEEAFDRGQSQGKHFYRGVFEVEINPPTDVKDIMKNPLGIFVNTFTIAEKTGH